MKRAGLVALAIVATAPLWAPPGRADCGAPELSVSPAQVEVGDELVVKGDYWNDVCNDTSVGVGCWERPTDEPQPSQDVELLLINRDTRERYRLGVVDADDDLEFELTTAVDVPPGWYVVKDADQQSYVTNESRFHVAEATE